ncbi:MAG: SDR family NAD(P)-dependent oxidoreductase [Paracoccus sp. (in: a-proteobacteria)]|nr:SDR family NAD(P)-dependent oxidoreductase [Paracoccus sp. (in: a-proteobacteria)]
MSRPAERIWIIGASRGIGAALARLYAARGARLILSARSAAGLAQIAAEAGGAEVIALDISDPASLAEAARRVAEGGPLDRAINLAGVMEARRAGEASADAAARCIAINLSGSVDFTREALPLLRPGGQLALTGSLAAYIGLPEAQPYGATKAAIVNYAQTLAAEQRGRADIRVINPGFVDTDMTKDKDFPMPFLLRADQTAAAIARGLDGRRFEIAFPLPLLFGVRLLAALPYWASLPIIRRLKP